MLILTGLTASGKSGLALVLARAFDAEIVGADSRQIYRGMEIGTAAPGLEARACVPHHLIGFLDPHERYSAARFVRDAAAAIDAIHARGRRAIVVGGTGFYVRALAGDVTLSPAYDAALRARLAREARVHPPDVLHAWLRALAPARAAAIAAHDPYRITRALEIALGAPASGGETPPPSLRVRGLAYRKYFLSIAPETLEARIADRADAMIGAGFVEEAERVGAGAVAADAVGYRDALAYRAGWSTADELRTALIRTTRRYAKRQATWFRTEPDLIRIPADDVARWHAAAREIPGWA